MDRIIYTAMTGANAAAHRQAVLSNNLANASTQGFRAEMSTFRSVPIQGDGSKTRVFALEATSGHVSTPGPVQRTGRHLAATAQLLPPPGLPVLSDGGAPIDVPPGAEVTLGSDGTVTAKAAGQPAQAI